MTMPPPHFNSTVDVLELVCEAVGFIGDHAAALLALRRCSHAWADAVSGAIRRDCQVTHPEAVSGGMAPVVAALPTAARLAVVSQPYGAVRGWLRAIPPSVLRTRDPQRFANDVKRLLSFVPSPTWLHVANNGTALTPTVVTALAATAATSLVSLRIEDTP